MGRSGLRILLLLLAAAGSSWCRLFPDTDGTSCSVSLQAVCGDKCIPLAWLCNGEQECPDGSDERCDEACHGDPNAWPCNDGKCVAASWRCDGTSDCMDGSDEKNCVCAERKIQCQGSKRCIDPWEICDQHKDCEDGSDEANCPLHRCLAGQWQCKNKVCIMEDWKCDGTDNCGDHSDEEVCASCPEGMTNCDKGKCILQSLMCNGIADCLDGTDEPSTCGKKCSLNNGGCMEKCTGTAWGVRCSCGPGWNLHPNGQNCTDVDECAMAYSPCSQLCKNTLGSFTCDCVQGYHLSNGTTCEATDGATEILLAIGHDLVFLDIQTRHLETLISTRTTPSSVAFDLLREAFYWADEGKRIHIYVPGKNETILYPDVSGVNSISVDWFTGQLYWASSFPHAIFAGLSDGRGYTKVLEKNLVPEQLTTFPDERRMYWVNRGEKGRTVIEAAGMDGSDRHTLAVLTTEEPVGLTLDYITSRLYWISEYKESIETVKVDGSGRYTFPETLLKGRDLLGLAVFEHWFFWADKGCLFSASRASPGVSVLLNASISSFTVLHELQQPPSNIAACAPGSCSHICLLSPVHPKGYKCACPEGMVLLLCGKCAELNVLYSTANQIYWLQVDPKGLVLQQQTLMPKWPENIHFQDMDWKRGLIYWTDDKGQLVRYNKEMMAKLTIPTDSAVCAASVDIRSGDLYWLTCDRTKIMVTTFAGMMTKILYQAAKGMIWQLFLDWQRAYLFWLEGSKPVQRMSLDGRDIKELWNETWTDVPVALDVASCSFLWTSKDMALKVLNLITHRAYNLKDRWEHGVAAAYGPYLVTFNETALVVWNRRTMEPSTIEAANVQKALMILDTNLKTGAVHAVPVAKPPVPGIAALAPTTSTTAVPQMALTTRVTTTATTTITVPTTIPARTTTKRVTTTPTTAVKTTTPTTAVKTTTPTTAVKTTTSTTKSTAVVTVICGWAQFACRNGRECVPFEYFCDGEEDCSDGTDEDNCSAFCNNPGMFRCRSGKKCISERYRCDGVHNCPDGSDESNCWAPTPECALRCDGSERCIPESWLCDWTPDCNDEADERNCDHAKCTELQFRCRSGQCISDFLHCDGDHDCKDHSDEEGCPVTKVHFCRSDETNCLTSGECILKEWLCDGDQDCKDESDEENCNLPQRECGANQWRCSGLHECIPALWRCDGEPDCRDWSDEHGCNPRKCQSHEFQCGETCLHYTLVCNGRSHCPGGLDEGRDCTVPCHKSCSQICYRSPSGPKCACNKGFSLRSDGQSCRDINECKELAEHSCSQACVNTHGGYNCTCHPGYLLEPDGHTCKVLGSEPALLVAVQFDLILYGLRSMKEDVIFTTEKELTIFSIDYDLVERNVFWMDLNAESIKWMNTETKQKGTLVKGVKSDSIAVDWIGRNLYWSDGLSGQVCAIQLHGPWRGNPEYAVVLDDLDQPRSLALHPQDGLMFWCTIGDEPKIEVAGMDGSNREIIIDEGLGWPTGITLDPLSRKIFWSDIKHHCIGSASLEGTKMKVFQLTEMRGPFSLTVFENYIYWSDMEARRVQRIDKNTGKNRTVLIKRHGQPYGLKVMHEVLQPAAPNPCARSGCSHLCLLNADGRGSCRCSEGLVLSSNGKTCIPLTESTFMFLVALTSVTQVYLKKLRPIEGQVTLPDHITLSLANITHLTAVDYSVRDAALYFSEFEGGFLKVLAIKENGRVSMKKILAVEGTVISLALDWLSGNIYWIDDQHLSIQLATSDGRYTHVVISDGLFHPISVVLHPPTAAMCVADLGSEDGLHGPMIECASMDGSERRILWKRSPFPVGLTITDAGSRLYWADHVKETVESIRMDGTQYRLLRRGLHGLTLFAIGEGTIIWTTPTHSRATRVCHSSLELVKSWWFRVSGKLVDIKTYSKSSQQGRNGCSEKNGGCSHICLPVPQGRSCRCTVGYNLERDTECAKAQSCPEPLQACKDNSKCIVRGQICDGGVDCPDGSDETNCKYIVAKEPQPTTPSWTTLLQTKPFPGKKNILAPIKSTTKKPPVTTAYVQPEVRKHRSTTIASTTAWAPPPGRERKTSTAQQWVKDSLVQGVVGSGPESQHCNRETCNLRGDCTVEDNRVKCKCVLGYSGDYCEEVDAKSTAGSTVLGIISVLLIVMAGAAVLLYLRKQRTRQRTSSTGSSKTLTSYQKDSGPGGDTFVEDETCINAAYDPGQELSAPLKTGTGKDT